MTENLTKIILTFVFIAACTFAAQAQGKPDLWVSKVEIIKDRSNLFVQKITVTVNNACREADADTSYVLVTFKQNDKKDAKAIYYVGNTVKALKGGESYTQTFDVSEKKIGVGRYVFAEADPYKKVSEASEENNWRTLFPNNSGAPVSASGCAAKM